MIPAADWEFDLRDETERKCLETLESLEADHVRGFISNAEYRTTLRFLVMAWRGLIDPDITNAMDDRYASVDDDGATEVSFFYNKLSPVIIARFNNVVERWVVCKDGTVSHRDDTNLIDQTLRDETLAAKNLFQKFRLAAMKAGMQEVKL